MGADAVEVRRATADDSALLTAMLAEAWDPSRRRSEHEVLSTPEIAHYVLGWPRPGDGGVVAEADGKGVGAAWWRTFPVDDPAYGFVDEHTPEIAIGVDPAWRGQGIGGRLLDALADAARTEELAALSLSVNEGNPARRLYARAGWVELWPDGGGSITMRLEL